MKKVLALILVTVMIAVMLPVMTHATGEDPDTYFYQRVDDDSEFTQLIGWWLHPDQWATLLEMKIGFISPNAFNGFTMVCQAGSPLMGIKLTDLSGNVVEDMTQVIAEGINDINFSKAYAPGKYMLKFTHMGASSQHFVIRATNNSGNVRFSVSGGVCNAAGTYADPAPAIKLKGAVNPNPGVSIVTDDDVWFCNPTGVDLGWGITGDPADQYIDITFTTPNAFSGFSAFFYTANSVIDVSVLDHTGVVLETFTYTLPAGDAINNILFDRCYAPGYYTIRLAFVSANPHTILGKSPSTDVPANVQFAINGYMVLNQGGFPYFKLIGDINPAAKQPLFGGTTGAGWWFHNIPVDLADPHITTTFTADQWFDRIQLTAYGAGAVDMELSTENGTVVDSLVFTSIFGDTNKAFAYFSRPHAPGRYVLKITPNNIPRADQNLYFLLGTGATESDSRVYVDANVYEAARHIAPAITLMGIDQPEFKLTKINASLTDGNMISINFKADNALFLDSDDNATVVAFTIDGEPAGEVEGVVSGDQRVFTLTGLSPEEMGKTITATLKTAVGGVQMTAPVVNYVPKTYFEALETNGTPNLSALAAATLNYGAKAQAYLGQTVTITADTTLLPASRAYVNSKNITSIATANKKASWKAVGLKLEDEVMIRYTFTVTDGLDTTTANVKFSYDGEVKKTVNLSDLTPVAAGRYVCYLPMPANKLSTEVTAVIYEGATAVSSTLTYSVESYAAAHQNDGDALADIVVAMMQYGDAAAAYVAAPNA